MLPIDNSRPVMPVESLVLHQLINRLEQNFITVGNKNSLQLVNEIPPQLVVHTSKITLTEVLNRLIHLLISESGENDIHISAKAFSNLVLVHIKKEEQVNGEKLNQKLERINRLVQQMGGCICVNTFKGTTISITFLNHQSVAA